MTNDLLLSYLQTAIKDWTHKIKTMGTSEDDVTEYDSSVQYNLTGGLCRYFLSFPNDTADMIPFIYLTEFIPNNVTKDLGGYWYPRNKLGHLCRLELLQTAFDYYSKHPINE